MNDTITLMYDPCAASPGWYVLACTVDSDASGLTTGEVVLATDQTPTGSFADLTGMTVSLPTAGTYELYATCSSSIVLASGTSVRHSFRLFDGTNQIGSQAVTVDVHSAGAGTFVGSSDIAKKYVATGPVTIHLQAITTATMLPPGSTQVFEGNANRSCTLGFVKVG